MDGAHCEKHVHESKLLEVDAVFGTGLKDRGVDSVKDWLEGPAGGRVVTGVIVKRVGGKRECQFSLCETRPIRARKERTTYFQAK